MRELTINDLPSSKMDEWWREHDDEYYHYLYRIDNTENKMFYYGIHSQKKDSGLLPENDGYMGSGTALLRAQKKHGIDKFTKTVLKVFSTRDEARLEEMKIVDDSLVKDRKCYNLTTGGSGALNFTGMGTYMNKDNPDDIRYLPIDDPLVISGQFIGTMKGVKQSKETILKKTGDKNGSWGTMWITNGADTKKIKKFDKIPEGWRSGRVDEPLEHINIETGEHKWFKKSDNVDETRWKQSILFINENLIKPNDLIELYNEKRNWEKISKELGVSSEKIHRMRRYYEERGYKFPNKK